MIKIVKGNNIEEVITALNTLGIMPFLTTDKYALYIEPPESKTVVIVTEKTKDKVITKTYENGKLIKEDIT